MEVVKKKIEELKFAEYNPRTLSEQQYADLKASLKEFGFAEPIIINKHKGRENIIVGGHQRVRVAKDIGIKEIPCVEVNLPPDKEKELNIRLNKNLGQWDMDMLANEFDKQDLLDWGFEGKDFSFPDEGEYDDDLDDVDLEGDSVGKGDVVIISFPNESEGMKFRERIGMPQKKKVLDYDTLKPHLK